MGRWGDENMYSFVYREIDSIAFTIYKTFVKRISHFFLTLLLIGFSLGAVAGSSNFDGIGGDDLSVYDSQTGDWYILSLSGDVLSLQQNWGWAQAIPAPWDYDGDGVTDLAVYARQSGKWYIASKATGDLIAFDLKWGGSSMISVPGDYDGDGKGDLALYQPNNGNWFILSLDGTVLAFAENWGKEGMVPVSGDYNGDGASDLAVYHRASGNWYIKTLKNELILFDENWGNTSMYPVPGDYDGDGIDDMAVYQQRSGKWFIRTIDGELVLADDKWGWSATQPVPGDYDGDGIDDLAVYHRATGNWYIKTVDGGLVAFEVNWGLQKGTTPSQTYVHRSTAGASIICYGDSITFGRGSSSNGPKTGYPELLERKLEQRFGGLYRCFNAGVPGETTSRGASRISSVLKSLPHASVFLLMEGTNDALSDGIFQTADNHLRAMLRTAEARGLDTYLSTVPPVVSSTPFRAEQAARIRRFNQFIPSIAASTGSTVVDTYSALVSLPRGQNFYADVNHPNDAGYEVVRDAFFAALRTSIRSGK